MLPTIIGLPLFFCVVVRLLCIESSITVRSALSMSSFSYICFDHFVISIQGTLTAIRDWFRDYKIPDGKPANKFGLGNKPASKVSLSSTSSVSLKHRCCSCNNTVSLYFLN